MFAHTSLGRETSTNAKAGLAPKPEVQPRSQEQESLEKFTPPTFSWNIGNIALSVPDDDGRTNPYNNGRAGWVPRRHAQLPWPMQAKLEVGSVDDPLEHEADRVAEQVMRMPDPAAQGSPTLSHEAGERNSGYPTLSGSSSAVQRKCSCGSCDKCKSEQADEEQHTVRRLPAAPQILAAASSPSAGKAAPPIVREVLRSPGRPLDRESRNYFEPRFQFDFSRVRIHADSPAAASAKAVNAQAYTVGSHIVLGSGLSTAKSPVGRSLMAHELAHVVQQGQGRPLSPDTEPVLQRQKADEPDEPLDVLLAREDALDQFAERIRNFVEGLQARQVATAERDVKVAPFFVQEDPDVQRMQQRLASGRAQVPARLAKLQNSFKLAARLYLQQVDDADGLKQQIALVQTVNSFIPELLRNTAEYEALLKRQKAAERDVSDTVRYLQEVRRTIETTKNLLSQRAGDLELRVQFLEKQAQTAAKKAGVEGDTPANEDQLTLLRTIIEGSPTLMPYLTQQRTQGTQPTDLRDRQRFQLHIRDEEFRDATRRAHIAPAEQGKAIGGFYHRQRDTIHLPRDSKFGHALHEDIHKYSPTAQCAQQLDANVQMLTPSTVTLCNCDSFLNEGLTQYFADVVLADQKLPKFTDHEYKKQLACAIQFVDQYGLDSVARLYFLNDTRGALNQFVQSKQCAHFCADRHLAVNDRSNPAGNEADVVPAKSFAASDANPTLRRKCSCGGSCDKCKAEQQNEEHGTAQRNAAGAAMSPIGLSSTTTAPPIVHDVLRSPGQPLDGPTRAFFEPRFGHSLNHVRVHANPRAADSADAIGSMAYTVGSNIVFGRDRFSPHSASGRNLLAHELAHVIHQQSRSAGMLRRTPCLHGSDCKFIPGDTGRFVERLHAPPKAGQVVVTESHMDVQIPDPSDPTGQRFIPPPSRQGEPAPNLKKLVEESGFKIAAEASGPFIDEGLSASVGAQAPLCSQFPGGIPKGAPKDGCCIQIYPEMEDRAKRLLDSKSPRTHAQDADALDLVSTVLHEAEHCHFNQSPETAKKIPAESDCNLNSVVFHGPGTGTNFPVKFYLSELSARIEEFAPYFQNFEASPTKENHDLLHQKEIDIALNKDESIRGIIHGLQCACSCDSVDALVESAVRNAMSSWPKGQARKFLEVMARILPSWWPKGLRSL